MLISIIIVNHNTGSILKECLNSLYEIEDRTVFEVVIVDNNSSDDSRQIIEAHDDKYDNVKTIFLNEDKGFSFANNRGYEISIGEYILIMNPDIIFKQQVFNRLMEGLNSSKDIGAICPALIGEDGKFQRNYFQRYPSLLQFLMFHSIFAKFFFKFPFLLNQFLENQDIQIKYKRMEEVEQIPFAFFLTRRELFEACGKMDEKYKLFFEDVDMSYNIHKKYRLILDTSARVVHLGGSSFKSKDNWWMHGRYLMSMNYFFDKNYSIVQSSLLKFFTVNNSLTALAVEYFKSLFKKNDKYRENKHKYFLKEFIKHYF